jgi:hypothetical protein
LPGEELLVNANSPTGNEQTSVGSEVDARPEGEVVSRSWTVSIFIRKSFSASREGGLLSSPIPEDARVASIHDGRPTTKLPFPILSLSYAEKSGSPRLLKARS